MTNLVRTLDVFTGDYFGIGLPDMKLTDVVEIIIISIFIYYLLAWVKNSRAWMLFRGIMVIMAFFAVAAVFQMNTILWIGEKLIGVVFIALLIVFQPELRKALEFLGRNSIWHTITSWSSFKDVTKRFSEASLNAMVTASYEMGAVKTGALIVIENEVSLSEYQRTGIPLDSLISRQLLINIFEKNTPLHDGAIIVQGDRITSATCYLPLSDNMNISKDLGTRHRAALGISEVSDALTIVVSEETGKVSATLEGEIFRDLQPDELIELLKKIQLPEDLEKIEKKHSKKKKGFKGIFGGQEEFDDYYDEADDNIENLDGEYYGEDYIEDEYSEDEYSEDEYSEDEYSEDEYSDNEYSDDGSKVYDFTDETNDAEDTIDGEDTTDAVLNDIADGLDLEAEKELSREDMPQNPEDDRVEKIDLSRMDDDDPDHLVTSSKEDAHEEEN